MLGCEETRRTMRQSRVFRMRNRASWAAIVYSHPKSQIHWLLTRATTGAGTRYRLELRPSCAPHFHFIPQSELVSIARAQSLYLRCFPVVGLMRMNSTTSLRPSCALPHANGLTPLRGAAAARYLMATAPIINLAVKARM